MLPAPRESNSMPPDSSSITTHKASLLRGNIHIIDATADHHFQDFKGEHPSSPDVVATLPTLQRVPFLPNGIHIFPSCTDAPSPISLVTRML